MKRTALFLALLTLALALLPGCTQEEEPADEKPVIYLYPETETEKRRAKELYRQFSGKDLRE